GAGLVAGLLRLADEPDEVLLHHPREAVQGCQGRRVGGAGGTRGEAGCEGREAHHAQRLPAGEGKHGDPCWSAGCHRPSRDRQGAVYAGPLPDCWSAGCHRPSRDRQGAVYAGPLPDGRGSDGGFMLDRSLTVAARTAVRLSHLVRLGVNPRLAIRPAEELVRLVVVDHLVLRRVPGQRPAELHREVRQDAARRRDVSLLDVGDRLATGLPGLEEVLPVPPQGAGDVLLQVLLGLVLGVLVVLVERGAAQRRLLRPRREELVLVDAHL